MPCHICGKLLSAAYITDHMRVHNQSQHHACHLCNRSKWGCLEILILSSKSCAIVILHTHTPAVFRLGYSTPLNVSSPFPPPSASLHHTDVPAGPRPEASRPGVEGQPQWFRRYRIRRHTSLPPVRRPLQNTHPAPGAHGHPRKQPGCPEPHHFQRGCRQLRHP